MQVTRVIPWQEDGVWQVDYVSGADGMADWALFRPGTRPDWAVVLHGHGADGTQLYTRADIRASWLAELNAQGVGILTPNLRGNAWMSPEAVHDLAELLNWLAGREPFDRTLFLSGSMGATGTLIFAGLHPERVNAVIARGAAVDLPAYVAWLQLHANFGVNAAIAEAIQCAYRHDPAQLKRHSPMEMLHSLTMPIYLFHGRDDEVMPCAEARRFAAAMAGNEQFHYREIEGGHDAPLTVPCKFDYEVWR